MDGEQKIFGMNAEDFAIGKKAVKTALDKQPFDIKTQEKFSNALADPATEKTQVQAPQQIDTRPNPLDVAKDIYAQKVDSTHTIDQINNNISKINNQIGNIKETLESPDVSLKQSYQNLLENKLTHIDESLKVALNKVGVEVVEPIVQGAKFGVQDAVQKFLSFLANSQSKLQGVSDEVKTLGDKGKQSSITPADLLAVQMKVGFVQQELELFTNLLNKALESTKTVMNVQI